MAENRMLAHGLPPCLRQQTEARVPQVRRQRRAGAVPIGGRRTLYANDASG